MLAFGESLPTVRCVVCHTVSGVIQRLSVIPVDVSYRFAGHLQFALSNRSTLGTGI
jgi:hypothetical protein